jgi:2-hydroxy-3-keto-5-methylthiopentenyl-1-phosphate phosphatase
MQVFCDFDGTISSVDTTDHILSRLARPEWEALEADWLAGRIDAAACMRGQIALIEGDDHALDAALDQVEIDAGFVDFAGWCVRGRTPLTVVSDGVDYFIRRVLARHALDNLPIISNRLAGVIGARRLEQPYSRQGCAAGAGVCKCQVTAPASEARDLVVYIGDGRSDFCVSARADVLFAKDALADYAAARGQAHHQFTTFHEITATLSALFESRRADAI